MVYRAVLFSLVHTLKPFSALNSKLQALLQLVIALVGRKIYPVETENENKKFRSNNNRCMKLKTVLYKHSKMYIAGGRASSE